MSDPTSGTCLLCHAPLLNHVDGCPTPRRHPSSEAFHRLLAAAGALHDKKQSDYGSDADPFANVRSAEEWGLPGSLGACIRMGDKLRRLQSFYRKGTLANESVADAFMDGLVYNGIGLLLYLEESGTSLDDALAAMGLQEVPAAIARCGARGWSNGIGSQCTLEQGHGADVRHSYETPEGAAEAPGSDEGNADLSQSTTPARVKCPRCFGAGFHGEGIRTRCALCHGAGECSRERAAGVIEP